MSQLLIYLFFIFSGAAGLIYQLVWVRKLVLIFGNTNYATASILTAFMGGLALGSYLIGKYANRVKYPLRFYAYLELGIGCSAIAILFLFLPVSDFVYIWAFNAFGDNQLIFNAIRFFLSIGVLIIPTTFMGGTLPIISQYIVHQQDMLGRKIGRLYALNTLGGVAGVVITGYYLIRSFGVNFTLWIAIGINLSIGIFAWLMSRHSESKKPVSNLKTKKTTEKASAKTTAGTDTNYSIRTTRIVLYLYGLAGFTSLAYEVVWTRALIFFISSTTYSFTTILATFLAGIFLGSLIITPFVDRIKNLLTWAAVLEIVIALSATATIFFFSNLSEFHVAMLPYFDQGNWSAVSILLFITCSLIVFIPTLCMGMLFPIINRIYVRQVNQVGRGVGYVSMANTIGAIIGSFCGGFILLPFLGLNASIVFLAALNLIIGVAFFLLARANHSASARKTYVPAIAVSVVVFILMNLAFFTPAPFYLDTGSFRNTRMLYHEDTASATLSALETKDRINIWGRNVRYLNVNGHNTAHTSFLDMIIHKTLAHLPMVLHPEPEKALVIGFGFGNSCQSFLQYDCLKQVDCVELVREEQETAQFFKEENAGIFEDPRFRFIVNDGRNFVLATQDEYDVISINSVDPKFSPTLYTSDFYLMCREKLTEKGQLVAWLPIYGMTAEEVQSLVKSFVVAFPHSSIWWNNPEHLLLLGFKSAYPFDLAVMMERLADPVVKQSLAAVHLDDPYTLLATFYSGEKMLADWAKKGPIHSDDFPLVEFCRVATNKMVPEVYERLVNAKESVIPYCVNFEALGDPEKVKQKLAAYEKQAEIMYSNLFTCQLLSRDPKYQKEVAEAMTVMQETLLAGPENEFNLMSYVDLMDHVDLHSAKPLFEKAIEYQPNFVKAQVFLGLEAEEREDFETALSYYQQAATINDKYMLALYHAAFLGMKLEKWEESRANFERIAELEPRLPYPQAALLQVNGMLEDYSKAILHAKKAIALQPEDVSLYFNMGLLYEKMGEIDQAVAAFEDGLKLAPNDDRARQKLSQLKSLR